MMMLCTNAQESAPRMSKYFGFPGMKLNEVITTGSSVFNLSSSCFSANAVTAGFIREALQNT